MVSTALLAIRDSIESIDNYQYLRNYWPESCILSVIAIDVIVPKVSLAIGDSMDSMDSSEYNRKYRQELSMLLSRAIDAVGDSSDGVDGAGS